jgi:UrcA family protein
LFKDGDRTESMTLALLASSDWPTGSNGYSFFTREGYDMIDARNFAAIRALALATVCGVLITALPAKSVAATSSNPPQLTVRFADLDLKQPHDAVVLYSRLRAAAEALCSPYSHGGMTNKPKFETCANEATADAVVKVNLEQPAVAQRRAPC